MIEEIINKIYSINITDGYIVIGDGDPIKRRGNKNKSLMSCLSPGLWDVFIIKNKIGKKEEFTDIILEKQGAKLDGLIERQYLSAMIIDSEAFLISELTTHDQVVAQLTRPGISQKIKTINQFRNALFEKDNFYYENKYAIIKNIPTGKYKVFIISAENDGLILSIKIQKKIIADNPAVIAIPVIPRPEENMFRREQIRIVAEDEDFY